jgi:hypothetical protein
VTLVDLEVDPHDSKGLIWLFGARWRTGENFNSVNPKRAAPAKLVTRYYDASKAGIGAQW